jgi:hypothetical protein
MTAFNLKQLFKYASVNFRFWHIATPQTNSQNGGTTTLADPLRKGEDGISTSQQSDLLPTERVLLCKTLERR